MSFKNRIATSFLISASTAWVTFGNGAATWAIAGARPVTWAWRAVRGCQDFTASASATRSMTTMPGPVAGTILITFLSVGLAMPTAWVKAPKQRLLQVNNTAI